MNDEMENMNPDANKPKAFKVTFKRLLDYLKKYKILLIIIIILGILSTVFNIFGPKLMGNATTEIFDGLISKYTKVDGGINFTSIRNILFSILGLYVLSGVFMYVQQYLMAGVSQKIIYQMRKEVSDKVSKLPLKYFDKTTKGDTLSRITNDIDNVSNTLSQGIVQLLSSILTIIGVAVMMVTINWILAVIVILGLPIISFVSAKISKYSARYFKMQWAETGKLNGRIEETYTGHNIVKAFGREEKEIEEFEVTNTELYKSSYKAQFVSGIIGPISNLLFNLNYVLICLIGAVNVSNGSMTVGEIQSFMQYSRQFSHPISQIANIINIIQSTVASAERVFDLLDEEEEPKEKSKAIKLKKVEGNVVFENVNFGYDKDVDIIKDMNIKVEKGQKIAIVGPTGAGKTTIVNLLMRFYDINSGTIKVDNVNICDMKRGDLRRIFGMVLQDTWLFNGTIKENIRYGREEATDEEIIEACKTANVDHFIRTLSDGYDTVLEEDAGNISQGQKQLLTIARAFLANPSILILDEATSSVDTRTEGLIQKAMEKLMTDRTSFVIAHRLSTIKNADIILVMKEGRIIEQGNHEELLNEQGFYADLYNSQFTECIDEIA